MTELSHTKSGVVAGLRIDHVDVIDFLADIVPGDWLDHLRRTRPETRSQAQKSHDALFTPAQPIAGQVTRAERHAVAAFVALLHQQAEAADFHLQLLQELSPTWFYAVRSAVAAGVTQGPYGKFPAGPLSIENQEGLELQLSDALRAVLGERLYAAFHHAHFLVFHPRDAAPERVRALEAAGWLPDDIVVLSQLVAFLSFQLRVVAGLRVLVEGWDEAIAVPATRSAVSQTVSAGPPPSSVAGAAPAVFTQAELQWQAWLEPLDESALTERHFAGLVDAARAKSPYFRLLARDPDTLGARTRTDKDIFYNPEAGLPRAERELAAAAASRYNGCIYCASVHARFASHFSRRKDDVQRLLDEGVQVNLDPRWNAIVDASVALSATPPRLNAHHIAALRNQGLDAQAAADLVHAAAFFNWANRLMLSLGEPQYA
ncbi:alkylhydroperoxidase domain protein [Comamonas sp. CMM02]|nr:alkylhydroperoxidase domain protein [Comamonas sp. CMM02]MBD9402240.1 alkylhydroperoxidase domain protein [Comamonas sp. CMM02]